MCYFNLGSLMKKMEVGVGKSSFPHTVGKNYKSLKWINQKEIYSHLQEINMN